ncbi:phosphoribosylaminoimidazole-succinocarboxamide synthase [Dentipellis sp. KUC8613]|nr:phosphoribosylaminoimidazole-succinocarboxamide synthase [Dentipellis sp. KUC8613]
MSVLTHSDLPGLTLVSKGKVRDIYATSSPDHLLFVASDRISAYDVILKNGIPDKGKLLTEISLFWFDKLRSVIPNHVATAKIEDMPAEVQKYKDQLAGRTMLVRKAKVIPLEAIVRGYITGSAWSEYQKSGTVHGIPLPAGLRESEKFSTPIFTPSTKAEQGEHDENISPERAAQLIGSELYERVSNTAVQLYTLAAEYALSRGLILADTKFEFGLIPSADGSASEQLILIDEALTPDSSRYWPAVGYSPGHPQPSFDKQYLRDWLKEQGFRKGLEGGMDGNGWTMSDAVVEGTKQRYVEARDKLIPKA